MSSAKAGVAMAVVAVSGCDAICSSGAQPTSSITDHLVIRWPGGRSSPDHQLNVPNVTISEECHHS